MKKLFLCLLVLFLASSCVPTGDAMQDAVAQTLTAVIPSVVEGPTLPPPATETTVPPTDTPVHAPATSRSCSDVNGIELLSQPWYLEAANGASEQYQEIDPNILQGKNKLLISYDLHGLMIREGDRKDESAIIFDQPHWFVISLANYGQNGLDGMQTIEVPLADFIGLPDEPSGTPGGAPLDLNQPVNMLHTRFWNSDHFTIDIISICIFNS